MLISESRAASVVVHRIEAPNSVPRVIKVVGLGAGGAEIARQVSERNFRCVEVVHLEATTSASTDAASSTEVLDAIAAGGTGLARALDGANMIFLTARVGDDVSFARVICGIARGLGVLVTGIMLQPVVGTGAGKTELDVLRAASDMLVISTDESYVLEMLAALGA